jgi:hypothetical protein
MYAGLLDCARKTIAADGVGALWKGFGPAMGRAFPANAATFVRALFISLIVRARMLMFFLSFVFRQLGVEVSRQFMNKFF